MAKAADVPLEVPGQRVPNERRPAEVIQAEDGSVTSTGLIVGAHGSPVLMGNPTEFDKAG
jgi:hypothetical protein